MKSHRRKSDSFALILVLFMIAIVSVLFVGFTITMRTERMAAAAMAGNERAKIIAQNAVEHATALLENNIPEPIGPGQTAPSSGYPENWCISPGLLTKWTGANGSTGSATLIPLSSTTSTDPTALASSFTNDYVNLNAQQLSSSSGSATYPIIPTGEALPVTWMYVLQDPTEPAGPTNQIVGRYAFWMDDENARINVNTAYGKPSTILGTIPNSSPSYNYLERSNPLDQATDNSNQINGSTNDPFLPNVGFNSLVGPVTNFFGYSTNAVTGSVTTVNIHSNNTVDPYHATTYTNEALIVGNPSTAGPATAGAVLRYYPLWHPAAVNIDILPTSLSTLTSIGARDYGGGLDRNTMADWVQNKQYTSASAYTQNWRLMQDPSQIEDFITNAAPASANFYQANKFNLTAYNRAPEFNVWGKPRLLMEDRIQTMQDPSTTGSADTCGKNMSGAELAFYTTPDLDPNGPMYFHGFENVAPWAGSGPTRYFPDLTAVQMVGDYLSNVLAKNNWPGMPAHSFVDKYTQGGTYSTLQAEMEADQVAWNIVSLGNYASNEEGDNGANVEWPDCRYLDSFRTTDTSLLDSVNNTSPLESLVSNIPGNYTTSSTVMAPDPNRCLRLGKLSGKAIMPFSMRPYMNEVALIVTAVPTGTTGQFYLKLSMEVEAYAPERGPGQAYWPHNDGLSFYLTHFFATISNAFSPSGSNINNLKFGGTGTTNGDGGTSDGYGTTFKGKNQAASGGTSKYPYLRAFAGGYQNAGGNGDVFQALNSYPTFITQLGNSIYVPTSAASTGTFQYESASTGSVVSTGSVQLFGYTSGPTTDHVTISAKARIFLCCNSNSAYTYEICPVWDNVDSTVSAVAPPTGQSDSLSWNFTIDLSAASVSQTLGGTYTRSIELPDPRLGGNSTPWVANSNTSSVLASDGFGGAALCNTLGSVNSNESSFDPDSYCYYDFQNPFYPNSPRPSIGFLGCIPTGMQRGIVNSILTFGPTGMAYSNSSYSASNNNSTPNPSGQLPDWLLLDLLAPSFMDVTLPSFAPYSYLHSTMGKINLNSTLYPTIVNTSTVTLQRWLPLTAVFQNMDSADTITTGGTSPPSGSIVANIMKQTLSPSGASVKYGAMNATPPSYDYLGELCEIKGVADGLNTPGGSSGTYWQNMAIIRNLANLFTTQSNTFHLWGAAQAVQIQKGSGNASYGAYQPGDTLTVIGEKRFESVIERKVWPGVDGVPGNGSLNSSGAYSEISADSISPIPAKYPWAAVAVSGTATSAAVNSPIGSSAATWAQFDGPDNPNQRSGVYTNAPGWYATPTYTSSLLLKANNPARAHMYYRPIMFRYLTE